MDKDEKSLHTDGLSDELLTVQQFAALAGKSTQSIYKRLNKVDNQVDNPIQPYVVVVDGRKMLKRQALSELYGIEVVQTIQHGCQPENEKLSTPLNPVEQQFESLERESDEIVFLREQIRRQNKMIEVLNKELEKEREHNREKDIQLLGTLAKLAETQAALAAGQNAEKQKALAETLIEGKQQAEMPDIAKKSEDTGDNVKKIGWFQRLLDLITVKKEK